MAARQRATASAAADAATRETLIKFLSRCDETKLSVALLLALPLVSPALPAFGRRWRPRNVQRAVDGFIRPAFGLDARGNQRGHDRHHYHMLCAAGLAGARRGGRGGFRQPLSVLAGRPSS